MTPEQRESENVAVLARREAEEKDRAARAIREAGHALESSLGRRYAFKAASLDTFQCRDDPARLVTIKRLRAIVPIIPQFCAEGRGLIFFGSVGTGKDHLLAAMLYQAVLQRLACKWVNGQEIFGKFRDGMDSGVSEESVISDLVAPDVLAISDPIPPAAAPSPFNLQQLYRILDRRYRDNRSTWVSLNAISADDADAKLSAPVFDRLRDGAELFRCFWPSYREKR